MTPRTIIILEDDSSTLRYIESCTRKAFESRRKLEVHRCRTEADFRVRVEDSAEESTIALISATFKASATRRRDGCDGIDRIIKLGLRVMWHRKVAVIAYSVLPIEDLQRLVALDIFRDSKSHAYFQLAMRRQPDRLRELIERLEPLSSAEYLRAIAIQFCFPQLQWLLQTVRHALVKRYGFNQPAHRREIRDHLVRLRFFMPAEWVETTELDRAVERFERGDLEMERSAHRVLDALPHIFSKWKELRNAAA